MALRIDNPQAESLARELANRTGESVAQAVIIALRERLERDLPGNLLRWVLPSIIWAEDGSRLPMSDIEKTPKGGGYGLPLKSQQIQIFEPEEHQQ